MRNSISPEDRILIEASNRGDSNAQLRLYQKYIKAMYNTVIRMINVQEDAEDILQDSFVKVFKFLPTFKGESTLGAWIKRITINTALNFIRSKKKNIFVPLEDGKINLISEENESPLKCDIKKIHFAIKKLPQGCRLVFSLYLLEGYQHKEIASVLNISESTSKTQYRRAKILLKEELSNLLQHE